MTLGNHRFHCWRRGGHGWLPMIDAIAQSCDVYFYDLSRRLGVDKIAAMANRFGLGGRTGIDLPGESPGLMPTRAWKQANMGTPWQPGENLVISIGQGYVLATPLQLAVMAARLANGGRAVRPHLTMRIRNHGEGREDLFPYSEPPEPMGISAHALSVVNEGMVQVTNGLRGTARWAQIDEEGFEMAGKTGTSQVRRITAAERMTGIIPNEQRPWRDRDHALFVAYAPIHAPRYACSVVVEHGGGGSRVAAPIARDILLECQRRNPARALPPGGLARAADAPGRG
jgi:penicillin-binding protein 2